MHSANARFILVSPFDNQLLTHLADGTLLVFHSKLVKFKNPPPTDIKDFMVPVLVSDLSSVVSDEWDMSIVRLISLINGVDSVKMLRIKSRMNADIFHQAIQHVIYHKCVILLDPFHWSAIYACRSTLRELWDDKELTNEYITFITRPNCQSTVKPQLWQLLSSCVPGTTIKDVVTVNNHLSVDVRRFVLFGIQFGYLQRLYRYPILMSPESTLNQTLIQKMDGSRHLDELALELEISYEKLLEIVLSNPSIAFVLK